MYLIILVFHSFLLNLFILYPSVRCTYTRTPNLQIREICARARTCVLGLDHRSRRSKSSFARLFGNRLTRIDHFWFNGFEKSINRFILQIRESDSFFSQNPFLAKCPSLKIPFSQNILLAKSLSCKVLLAKSHRPLAKIPPRTLC